MSKTKSLLFLILDTAAGELGISGADKFVLVTLAKHLNPQRNGALVWPSQARLVALTGSSERSIRRSLARLENLGYIKRQQSDRRNNIYAVQSDVISASIDTGQGDRYNGDTGQGDRSTPATVAGKTGQGGRLMVNRTTKEKADITIVDRSPGRKVCTDAHQRRMALLGIIEQTGTAMRTDDAERPTEQKQKRAAHG